MPRSSVVCLVALAALAATVTLPAYSAGLGLKAGLWDVRLVKQVMDGRDVSAQLAASLAKMQQALASLPAEQRARMQALLEQSGVSQGNNGSFRICVSPEMAKRDTPILDGSGHCQPAALSRSGNTTTFRFSCNSNGTTMVGQGEAIAANDLITTQTDMMTRTASGTTHTLQNETQMRYVGADCGELKSPEH